MGVTLKISETGSDGTTPGYKVTARLSADETYPVRIALIGANDREWATKLQAPDARRLAYALLAIAEEADR